MGVDNISMYTCTYMLQSYCLVQAWPFIELLSGPSKAYYLVQVPFLANFIVVSSDLLQTQLSFCVFSKSGFFQSSVF